MTKLEKIKEQLKVCIKGKCPQDCEFLPFDNCWMALVGELLKEQEPVKPIDETYWNYTYGRCGHCRAPLPALEGLHSKFCWMCGQAVKWE